MTTVRIFKHEDSDEKNVISLLFEGEHIIGREKPINCSDKRISRKHAIISVKRDGVTLEALHVNPCFLRSSQDSNIEKLKKDNCIALNDGDQFSMLADSEWFRVKVTIGNSSENEAQTFCMDNNKRSQNDFDDLEKKQKRLKPNEEISANNIVAADNVNIQHTLISSFQHQEIIDTADVLINNLDNIYEEESEDCEKERANNISVSNYAEQNSLKDTSPKESSVNDTTIIQVDSTADNSISPVQEDCLLGNSTEHEMSLINQAGPTESQNIPNHVYAITTNINPAEGVKKEPDSTSEENTVPSTSVKQEPVCQEDIKQESDNTAIPTSNGPSSSNSQNNMRRDRCWYGPNCYRKNSTHRLNISHPGDNDYDSDPNDVRAICPYERACYRVDPQHRREFKHYGKPAPKPSNVRLIVNVENCQCPNCKHNKRGYESDYGSDESGNEF